MKRSVYAFLFAATAVTAAAPAAADQFKCACNKNAVTGVEAYDKHKLICVETFKDYNSSVSVQESHLSVYVDDKNSVQSDKDMNIRFRPRDGKCLDAVYDGNTKNALWTGPSCNTSDYKSVGTFNMKEQNGNWLATYKALTSGKDYTGMAMFTLQGDGKRYMTALCIED